MKPKKRKEKIDLIIEEMANGCTTYAADVEDDIGECGFCYELSYRDHRPNCPVLIARELLKERRHGRR